MIAHVLRAARLSHPFSIVRVSTKDCAFRDSSSKAGFTPALMRPDTLADNNALIVSFRHVTEEYASREQQFDEVWLLMACSTFIISRDLCRAAIVINDLEGE